MPLEIERKFLVKPGAWHPDPSSARHYRQGYICSAPDRVVRVRLAGDEAFITVKGATDGITRLEFEYPIPAEDAGMMLDRLCGRPLIEKTRYHETFAGRLWEIDVFEKENAGLVLAEVELPSADAGVELPPWAGAEVSDDPRYYNASLARRPFTTWGASA